MRALGIQPLSSVENHNYVLLPPATKLRQGNVFTPVCDSVHGGLSVPAGTTDHITGGSVSRGVSVQGVSLSMILINLFLSLSLPPVFEFRPPPKQHSAVA